jgi:hypothetical protein
MPLWEQFRRLRPSIGAAAGLLALAAPAVADDVRPAGQLITCSTTRADAASVSVSDLHLGVTDAYVWARARLHLSMRDGSVREYALQGRADPISKALPPNDATPGFAYPGFACTIQYPAITSVHGCGGSKQRRTCEIGLQMFGTPLSFSVSLTAQRVTVREATTIP